MENFISKLNFLKLLTYLVDKGIPTLPSRRYKNSPGGHNRVGNEKRKCVYVHLRSRRAGGDTLNGE